LGRFIEEHAPNLHRQRTNGTPENDFMSGGSGTFGTGMGARTGTRTGTAGTGSGTCINSTGGGITAGGATGAGAAGGGIWGISGSSWTNKVRM
jgi:hypothetical protein